MSEPAIVYPDLLVKLVRLSDDGYATRGQVLTAENVQLCYMLELPWRDNAPGRSCIPVGRYRCELRYSPRHRCQLYGVDNVPNRADIEIHPATWPSQLLGCLAPGTHFGQVCDEHGNNPMPGILESRIAHEILLKHTGGKPFTLAISDEASDE